ncbi:TPA: hypothetical protein AB5C39_001847 [Vibrio mimicus]|uniref:hypothetical protein n=1 Tax=Vibrio cholerae TaxID=666 RepID=UPI002A52A99C|nr:hypothetical protein [Vibrio cholerae]EJL6582291.1 hypothetical protein [Vibrio cholerae]EKA4522897.1 hypothetical protein [Vibrio cholerae]EKF9121563.1 hypothetical protein [Vibrio cholerae]
MEKNTEKMCLEQVTQQARVHLNNTLEAFKRTGKASRNAQRNYRAASLTLTSKKGQA